jgi:NAD(P)H-hydrate repair Nnr-like enzyme with NAD(P)H-hydrate epimerase domain
MQPLFLSKSNFLFSPTSHEATHRIRAALINKYYLNNLQIAEAASYSMAMVVRYALGLTAQDGQVLVFVNDSLPGLISLATARHLSVAGSSCTVITYNNRDNKSAEFSSLVNITKALQIPIHDSVNVDSIEVMLNNSHNVILGLFDIERPVNSDYDKLIEILNEARTPIHCIDMPLGVDVETGQGLSNPLFASSTLSLGTVYSGLFNGATYAGRHYICDISICKELYLSEGLDLCPLFYEQPVTQIFPQNKND